MKIGLSYALEGEIESILKHTQAKRLETAGGVDIYEIEPDIFAFTGGVGKVNADGRSSLSTGITRTGSSMPGWRGVFGTCRSERWFWRVTLSSTTWIRPPPGTPLGWCPR